jgi:hypothetical protein
VPHVFGRRPPIDPELRAALLTRIPAAQGRPESLLWDRLKCAHCGGVHMHACPRVKRMRFSDDGKRIIEVEFWPDGEWETKNIVWPWQIHEERAPTGELTSAPVTGSQEVVK